MDSLQLFISLELIFWSYVFNCPSSQTKILFLATSNLFYQQNYHRPFIFLEFNFIFSGHLKINYRNILLREFHLAKQAQFYVTCTNICTGKSKVCRKKNLSFNSYIFYFYCCYCMKLPQVCPLNCGQCN